ncbi:hypothetical protein Fmac_028002 [Flemingia macrophylla]|uniref:Uncharacterized protein n=1 Tax=Flemingia macrophylla TaxID=520843 RepID=A0ABD1LJB8_9FABA
MPCCCSFTSFIAPGVGVGSFCFSEEGKGTFNLISLCQVSFLSENPIELVWHNLQVLILWKM